MPGPFFFLRLLFVVPAKAGTHTAESLGFGRRPVPELNHPGLWLWVLAFARTTGAGGTRDPSTTAVWLWAPAFAGATITAE